jgi:tetratricopeptide (TPR) repeat protein
MNKKITYSGILLFLIAILVSPSFSQIISEPRPVCEGSQLVDGTYIPKGEVREVTINGVRYRCVGCGGCTPISSNSTGGTSSYAPSPSLSPSQQMQLQMFQGIMAPLFGALGQMVHDSMMNLMMPKPDTSYQQRQQQEVLRKQQEEAKKKAYEAWQRHMKEAEEQARKEEEARRRAGQDILSQVRIGSGPFGSYTIIGPRVSERETLSRIDWDNLRPQSTSAIKTIETVKEQLLKAAYFSKMAETFLQSGDLEAARFYAGLAFEGDAGSPRHINYNPPKELLDAMDSKKVIELNDKLTKMAKFYKLAMPNFEALQAIYSELESIKTKKEESKKKIEELEKQIKELKAKKQVEASTEKKTPSPAEDLLAQALALKQQAENEYQEALKNEEKLLKEKKEIENKLNELKKDLIEIKK